MESDSKSRSLSDLIRRARRTAAGYSARRGTRRCAIHNQAARNAAMCPTVVRPFGLRPENASAALQSLRIE